LLHITNGSHAAGGIRAAGLPGEVLAWNDVLHDGPVPGDVSFNQLRAIRARFISDLGWRAPDEALREFAERDRTLEKSLSHEEVVLWFEHDLYDQLQLLQLLDWFATCELGATRLTLICDAEYLGPSTPQRLAERFPDRQPVTDDQFDGARRAWRAFRSDNPRDIEQCVREDNTALPFVSAALRRHLEQFPSTTNGLSRTEHQALDVLSLEARPFGPLFVETQKREDPFYLGDSSFAAYLTALSNAKYPLVAGAGAQRLTPLVARVESAVPLELTDVGRAVLSGSADHIALNGIDRWLGGVQLIGPASPWRWDPAGQILISSS
jgi:hypothetical protein